ncbi:unnamed protein product [Ilex paraguariensis]|uniref:Inner membrane localized protein n=1 Tax=Ilex paraguariensis TaxID=185542 RepID=A0ABC8U9E7_9AQUA
MSALSNSLVLPKSSSSNHLSTVHQCITSVGPTNLSFIQSAGKVRFPTSRRALSVQAGYSDGGRPGSTSIFVSGFVLGGLVVGTLGCVYAPQISKALAGADKKDLMRKLPKFIYDEEKALERTRKILADKIEQLNSAIDDVSTQLRQEDTPNGEAVKSDEIEAII